MPNGRPREYDLKKVAKDLIEWAQKDDSWNLCGFSADFLIPAATVLRWKDEDPDFREAFDIAKNILGKRRERDLSRGKLHVKAYDLNATCYDKYLKDERIDIMRVEAALNKDKEQALDDGNMQRYNAIQKMLFDLQKQKKAAPSSRKKAETSE